MNTVLRKRDAAKNMARFYALRAQGTLGGAWVLCREWGRIGSPGVVRYEPSEDVAARAQVIESAKRKGGYG